MKIGIVGGSIAGCSAAILLLKEGYEVTVFERSDKNLVGRGGGIGTLPSLMEELMNDGVINESFAYFQINHMPFVGKTESSEPFGRTAWSMPMNFHVFQWTELWEHLRSNVPDRCYRRGTPVINAVPLDDGRVELTPESGNRESFDLVLFADGYHSFGRHLLFPEKKLQYRGYILWRGLLPEAAMERESPLQDEILRLSYTGEPGNNVVYFIPSPDGSVRKGERVFNWAAYIAVPENDLSRLMTDKNGKIWEGTLPSGHLSADNEIRLKMFLSGNIPRFYGEMIQKTTDSYIQVIYTLDLDSYHKGNMCLIGDAGMVIQPFTGSGVFKGYHNVKELIECLDQYDHQEEALEAWSDRQVQAGKRILALGEQMEKAFIWEQLDFAKVDEETTRNWWKSSVSFPEDFNYEKKDD